MAVVGVTNANQPPQGAGDAELIARVRAGDAAAYGELYERHVGAALACSRAMTRNRSDADDIVNEAFTRVLNALKNSGGPEVAFRPYLLTAVRHAAYDRTRKSKRIDVVEEVDRVASIDLLLADEDFGAGAEREIIAKAYGSLPERWRMVLWHTEVEGMSPADVAPLLGIAPNAVAALAYRAREGLRQAYLQAHVRDSENPDCVWAIDRMSAYHRDRLPGKERAGLEAHLEICGGCRDRLAEIADVGSSMRAVLLPLVVGPGAAAGYLKLLGTSTAAATGVAGLIRRGAQRAAKQLQSKPAASAAVAASLVVVSVGIGIAVSRPESASTFAERVSVATPDATDSRDASPKAGAESDTSSSSSTSSSSNAATPQSSTNLESNSTPASSAAATGNTRVPAAPGSSISVVPVAVPIDDPGTPTPPTPPSSEPVVTPITPPPTSAPGSTSTSAPLPPGEVAVSVRLIGEQVQGRRGAVSAAIRNAGLGPAAPVTVAVDVPGASSVVLQTASGACATGTSSASCIMSSIAAGGSDDLIVLYETSRTDVTMTVQADLLGDTDLSNNGSSITFSRVVEGLGPAFVAIDRGDVVQTGNSLLTCSIGVVGCGDAQSRIGSALANNSWNMTPVDVDSDLMTVNSSNADLEVPVSATVMWAGLYWAADLSAGTGGSAAPNAGANGTVKFSTPAASNTVIADKVTTDPAKPSRYQGFADVTDLVRAAGSGSYQVGNVQAGTGADRYAGWSLVVAYRDASLPVRSLYAFDGLRRVAGGQPVTAQLSGFEYTTGKRANLGIVSYEGDAGTTGDTVTVGGTQISDAANPVNDLFNSTVARLGVEQLLRLPNHRNTFGYDLDTVDIGGVIPNGATNTNVVFGSTGDVYLIGSVTVAIDR